MTIAERLEQKGRQEGRMEDAWKDAWKERLKKPWLLRATSENGDDAGAD